MLDFPSPATANQIFTAPNGTQWIYDGVKWEAATSGGFLLMVGAGAQNAEPAFKSKYR
jgi:hypothetical protein